METGTIIEIQGVKMEVDYRSAKAARVDTFRVGTKVKVLQKNYSGFSVKAGVVVGFDPFEKLPSIQIATIETAYGSNPVAFIAFNAESKDIEVIAASDDETQGMYQKASVVQTLERNIETKLAELQQAKSAYALFMKHFAEPVPVAEQA